MGVCSRPEQGSRAPLADTLGRIQHEIDRLQDSLLAIESFVLSELLNAHDAPELQELDLIIQSLHSLSNFVSEVAAGTPKQLSVSLEAPLRSVLLEAMALRLSGGASEPISRNDDTPNVELF